MSTGELLCIADYPGWWANFFSLIWMSQLVLRRFLLIPRKLDYRASASRGPETDAVAARITCQAGELKRSRMKVGGGSFLSSHDPRMVLGWDLGNARRWIGWK